MPSQSNLHGCLWMAGGGLLFVAVTVSVRLIGSDLPAAQAAFIRYVFGIVLLLPLLWRLRWRGVRRASLPLYAWRGLTHGIGVMLWFYAMARIPLAEVTAIGFSTPVFTALGAVFLLGEQVRLRRALAIVAGFVGMLVILRPGFNDISIGSLAQLCATLFFAGSYLLAKRLTREESALDIIIMLTLCSTLALLPAALYDWRAPTPGELGGLALVALFATAGHYALTRAFALAPLTVTQPLTFLQLVWAVLFGYWLFDEVPDGGVVLGALLIVAAVSYLAHRESQAARRARVRAAEAQSTVA